MSFFAYAPYANVSTTETSGITSFSSNTTAGDPTVSYALTTDGSENVDLLWGTAGSNGTTEDGTTQGGTTLTDGLAAVNANLTKMKTSGKVQFNFKHALAQFGGYDENDKVGILIKAAPDIEDEDALGNTTKITVKSLTITTDGTDGTTGSQQKLVTSGTLNLATGVWTLGDAAATTLKTELTSASSTDATPTLNNDIAEPVSVDTLFDSDTKTSTVEGVITKTAKSVYYDDDAAAPFYFIPGSTLPSFKVTITYIVRTQDKKLAKGYSETTNTITKTVSFGTTEIAMNKRYSLTLILGINSVDFDATVTDWETTTTSSDGSSTTDNTDVYLPVNVSD